MTFYPQMDGTTEHVNCSIGQILCSVVLPDQTDWVEKIPLVEFAINSSINHSMGFAPFEIVYGTMPMMAVRLPDGPVLPGVHQFVQRALDNLLMAHDTIIDSRVHQTFYVNKRRQDENSTGKQATIH